MSYTTSQLLKMASNYEQLAVDTLVATAKKKEKKKLDPKAKVRNRGTVCVPAESAKDKKDHFPINDADQARNALARVHQYSSVPEWYSGSLAGLQALVARKVKAKYPKIDVGGKKEKKSSLEAELLAFAQEAGGSVWNPTEQTEGDVATFMQPGGENRVPGAGGGVLTLPTQTVVSQRQKPDEQLRAAQAGLNKLQYKGKDGRPLDEDGLMGPNTQFAVNAYIAKNKDRIPEGFAQAGSGLYEMIKRDASGENKTTTFDHKAANDALNTASAFLTQLQAWQGQGQITAQNVAQLNQMLGQYAQSIAPVLKNIGDTLQDQRSTQQEKQLAMQLNQKAAKLNDDMKAWIKLFNEISATATRK